MTRATAALAAALLLAGCGSHGPSAAQPARLHCTGSGSPVVVLEAGLGASHAAWREVQPALARVTRTCSYDRLRGPRRTAPQDLADLHDLLRRGKVEPPLVLVGHSFGGVLIHLYAAAFPKDVAGVVLIDAENPRQTRAFLAALGRPRATEPSIAKQLRAFLSHPEANPEGMNVEAAFAEARLAPSLGDRPLVVVEAGRETRGELPPGFRLLLDRTWSRLQAELARLSTNHIHVTAPLSGHDVPSDEPEIVVTAARTVVQTVRAHSSLPSCDRAFARTASVCVSG